MSNRIRNAMLAHAGPAERAEKNLASAQVQRLSEEAAADAAILQQTLAEQGVDLTPDLVLFLVLTGNKPVVKAKRTSSLVR